MNTLRHISENIKHGLPSEIIVYSVKSGKIDIEYSLGYQKIIKNGGEIAMIEPIMELYVHGIKHGFLAVTNHYEMPDTEDAEKIFHAIQYSIERFNKIVSELAGLIVAENSYAPFLCPDFKSLENDIRERFFY